MEPGIGITTECVTSNIIMTGKQNVHLVNKHTQKQKTLASKVMERYIFKHTICPLPRTVAYLKLLS